MYKRVCVWVCRNHWRRIVKNIGRKNVVKKDKGDSQLLGARAQAAPQVYAYGRNRSYHTKNSRPKMFLLRVGCCLLVNGIAKKR